MAVALVAYASFPGNAREAMTYYQEVFGGELSISTFADYGMEGMPPDGVMHSELATDAFRLMGADAMGGATETGSQVSLAFMGDDLARMTGWFERIAADGTVRMPLESQVWGDIYGDIVDKYGLTWMFNIEVPQASA